MLKTIIFDIDETIYSYTGCHAKGLHKIDTYCQERFGFEPGTVKTWWKIIFHEITERLGFDNVCTHDTMLRIQTILERNGVNPLPYARAIHNMYWDTVVGEMVPFDGVIALMKQAKEKGLRIGVATDLLAEIQFRKLEKLGVIDYIDFIVTSEEAGCEKPHRGIFDYCLEKAGCKAEECLMIGDNWAKDIAGAMDMGMAYAWHIPGRDITDVEEERREAAFCNYYELAEKILEDV